MKSPENKFQVSISDLPTENADFLLGHIKEIREKFNKNGKLEFSFSDPHEDYRGLVKINSKDSLVEFSINNPKHITRIKNHPDWELKRILFITKSEGFELKLKESFFKKIISILTDTFKKSA